ncbi:hypothetical protein Pan189_02290 [Stratiformator vulcanicus]|uniref:Uncharacterized protein n=1 Tax=Stratiformator vulcanicus TaxID=2527980 RepID=A0A517QW37_9PLAN|nr:hypothetical protein Pan189_02290 [Stratiformator vulcanicus]
MWERRGIPVGWPGMALSPPPERQFSNLRLLHQGATEHAITVSAVEVPSTTTSLKFLLVRSDSRLDNAARFAFWMSAVIHLDISALGKDNSTHIDALFSFPITELTDVEHT